MNVQWYPGHMTKAKRQMQEDIKLIDLIIELVDARVPLSSRNPDIDELGKNKARMILLNKADLADERPEPCLDGIFQRKRNLCGEVLIPAIRDLDEGRFCGNHRRHVRKRQRETGDEESKTVRYVRWLQESLMLENQHLSIPLQEKPVPRPVINQELQKENSGYV